MCSKARPMPRATRRKRRASNPSWPRRAHSMSSCPPRSSIAARASSTDQAAQRADAVDDAESEIARQAQRRDVVGEQPVQRIGGRRQCERIETPPAFVAVQRVEIADVEAEAARIHHAFGERGGILEAEIQSLSGDGMDAMRRIAGER